MAEDGPRQVAGVAQGLILAGKYRVERVLGAGGMGVVVAAHHIGLDEKVAIKFLLPEMLSNADAVNRFAREARNAVKIKGEHMARVFDVGTLDTGAPYMVMEFLEGGDLHHWLQQRGPVRFEQAVDFILQACEVIAEAHSLGIIHRDLKPANLFLNKRRDGTTMVKVLDFGISKVIDLNATSSANRTASGLVMGTPGYMSPEQVRGAKGVDPRTDIWALGVILFELVTGARLFAGETVGEVLAQVLSDPLPSVRDYRADVPEGIGVVIAQCLERRVERRLPNVGELAAKLVPFGPSSAKDSLERILRWRAASVVASPGGGTRTASAVGAPPVDTEPPWLRSGTADLAARRAAGATKRIALLAGGIAATIGIGVYALLTRPTPSEIRDGVALATSGATGVRAAALAMENVPSTVLAPAPPGPEALAPATLDAGSSKVRAAASAATRGQPTRRHTNPPGAYPSSTSTSTPPPTSDEKDLY